MRREWLAVAPFLSRRRADVHDCVGDLLRAARPSPSLHCFSQHGAFPYIEHNPPTPAPSKSLQPLSLRFPCRSAFRRDALLHDSNFHIVVPALRQAQERPDFDRAETQCHCSSHCWASLRGAPWVPSRATIRTRRANHSNSVVGAPSGAMLSRTFRTSTSSSLPFDWLRTGRTSSGQRPSDCALRTPAHRYAALD